MKLKNKEKTIKVCGKIIVTGEHCVLRGGLAVAYPFYNKLLEMIVMPPGRKKNDKRFQLIDQKLLQRALEICGKSLSDLKESVFIRNSLEGGGLGSSAALCVALGRLMVDQKWISSSNLFKYCHTLENFFHGESSGLDIAVILKGKPISYQREEGAKDIQVRWSPCFYVSFSGQKSITSQNIKLVQGQERKCIDQKMSYASELVIKALQKTSSDKLPLLVEAVQTAHSCFKEWLLISDTLGKHISQCQKDGAIASKPTGSGNGGYVLSLFNRPPSLPVYINASLPLSHHLPINNFL